MTRIDHKFQLSASLGVVLGTPGGVKFRDSMCSLDHGDPAGFCGGRPGRSNFNAAVDPAGVE